MTALLRYLSGYVCLELTGYATERFLNLCTNHDINLWNMDHKEDTYTFCMSLEDFWKIRPMDGAPVTDGDLAMPVAWNCNDTLFRVEHAKGNAKDYVGRNACNGLCSLRDV